MPRGASAGVCRGGADAGPVTVAHVLDGNILERAPTTKPEVKRRLLLHLALCREEPELLKDVVEVYADCSVDTRLVIEGEVRNATPGTGVVQHRVCVCLVRLRCVCFDRMRCTGQLGCVVSGPWRATLC